MIYGFYFCDFSVKSSKQIILHSFVILFFYVYKIIFPSIKSKFHKSKTTEKKSRYTRKNIKGR